MQDKSSKDERIILHGASNYSDERGNRVVGTLPENAEIWFEGENGVIEVGEGFALKGEGTRFRVCSGGHITIGENVKMGDWGMVNTYPDGTIEIGANSRFAPGFFVSAYSDALIRLGDGFTMENGSTMLALPYTRIIFGRDAMVSRNVFMQSEDGHTIFDVNTGAKLAMTEKISREREIIVGEHVWIGQSAILLYNTYIGDGSIVGAGALVKGTFPNNCSIAGVPARVIRRDVAWSRDYDAEFDAVPPEWKRRTEED